MCSILGLDVVLRVEARVEDDDLVGSSQIYASSPSLCGEHEDWDRAIGSVELVNHILPQSNRRRAIQT